MKTYTPPNANMLHKAMGIPAGKKLSLADILKSKAKPKAMKAAC